LAGVTAELASSRERSSQAGLSIEEVGEHIAAQVQQSLNAMGERVASVQLSVDAASVRIGSVEQGIMSATSRIEHLEQKPVPAADPQIAEGLQSGIAASAARIARLEESLQQAHQHVAALAERPAAAPENPEVQKNLAALNDRLSHLEQGVDGVVKRTAELHDLVAQDLQAFEKTLQSQSSSIESARTAMAQTDDLVERVVEALESLQTIVLEQSGERTMSLG